MAQQVLNVDHFRKLQGQLREHITDKANLLSENKDLAYALNLTRSELAAAKKASVEMQMAQGM
ncbi:hypothetical protein THRCLA_20141 [Thraustotheca clavata]|uniref:Uncharacterized protein n=1 Tax=Thraustotheca clavata TaxID=74557 RepID=A0A1W0AB25_9STRA|nr:hypothetical protein THRCLA_20141 [Thraustotheca clavata]